MANKYIPKDKRSKKLRRAEYAKQRRGWEDMSPVTRVIKDRKKFDRNRVKQQTRKDISENN